MPGLTVAEAKALVPGLIVGDADPDGDAAGLQSLAAWCQRWTPRVALDGDDGLLLDIAGCGHLFGGDGALIAEVERRLIKAGIEVRLGAAATPAAAWAWTRYRPSGAVPVLVAAEHAEAHLGRLPVAGLRVPPDLVQALARVGLRTVGDLQRLPRAALARRFGPTLIERLDRLLGQAADPITPSGPPSRWAARLALAEPISRKEDFERAIGCLLAELVTSLGAGGLGARSLVLTLFRVDASTQILSVGTAQASRDARHLHRLFAERYEKINPGYGVETLILEATATERLDPAQLTAGRGSQRPSMAEIVDRLRARAGHTAALRFATVETHVPERATRLRASEGEMPAAGAPDWLESEMRPLLLLSPPEPIVTDRNDASVPDTFYWRGRCHHVMRSDGPERIRSEWWRDGQSAVRDYFRIQDQQGRRYWVFRRQGTARDGWFIHGLFA